jgi:ketosteroid isomerase-like protein
MSRAIQWGAAAVLLGLTGCGGSSSADAKVIQARSELWSKAASVKDLPSFVGFYAADATVMLPNEPAIQGTDAIRAVIAPMMQDPNFALSFTPAKVEVSGILGYTEGAISLRTTGRDSKPLSDNGKYLRVWKKQPDGSWKAIEDIFNSDLPAPGK